MDSAIIGRIAQETAIPESSVAVTVSLFEKGATGPFIVHYRKEATGGLDEAKVRSIQERMAHYREVYDQRVALLKFLSEQGKLTDELRAKIESCFTKAELDDLHHQFRPRKKTRAAEAAERDFADLGHPGQVTGVGSLFCLHWTNERLTDFRSSRPADPGELLRVFLGLLNEGVLLSQRGMGACSLAMTEGDIEIMARISAVHQTHPLARRPARAPVVACAGDQPPLRRPHPRGPRRPRTA